jgi:hypothetical protein
MTAYSEALRYWIQDFAELERCLQGLNERSLYVKMNICKIIFMFAPYINSIKTLFIVPTDAHYYEIIEMLKQFKIVTLAPTCFISRRNHHQGPVLCLIKTVVQVCGSNAHPHNRLICRHNIDYVYTDEHRKTIFVVLEKHRTAP